MQNGRTPHPDPALSVVGGAPNVQQLLVNLPGMLYSCSNDEFRTMEFASAGAQLLTGFSAYELLEGDRRLFGRLIHEDDRATVFAEIQSAARGGRAYQLTYRLITRDDKQKWVFEHGNAVFDATRGEMVLQGYVSDISYQRYVEEALREREERFNLITRATSDTIRDWDPSADYIWWNGGVRNFFGFSQMDISHIRDWLGHIVTEDRGRIEASLHRFLGSPSESWTEEYRFARKDGSVAYVLDRGFAVRDSNGRALRMLASMVDITDRKAAELERMQMYDRLREQADLLDKAHDAIIVSDSEGVISYWNKGAERLYGFTSQESIGSRRIGLLSSDPSVYNEAIQIVLETGDWRGELKKRHKTGHTLTVEVHWTLVKDEAGVPKSILSIETDITKRKAAEREIESLAFYDPLTGLPNRRLLLDRLRHAADNAHRVQRCGALLFIDLDNFKSLNDSLGHDKGDMLLEQVARRIEAPLRKTNTVARLGGDEFVVMLEDLSFDAVKAAAQAELVAEKILALFQAPFVLHEYEHHTTPSIGVAIFGRLDDEVDEIMKRADLAMYQAKAAGRNTIRFFDPEMQAAVSARVAMEADFRVGLHRQQFMLHYQCQVDAAGVTKGVEALVRWRHPKHGMVSPALFIPLAEESGLILRLGEWVLDTACQQLAIWATMPGKEHLTIAVNVSARQFRHPDFVDKVLITLAQTGANPRKLKLELTESLLVQNMEETIEKMTALKRRGIGFSLDDFGTGYSSLSYLKRLPLDQIKIDQSFVRDVLTDTKDTSIVRTILTLGQSLGLEVIAEGVETIEQRDFLEQQGCYVYQGYLFCRGMTADQI